MVYFLSDIHLGLGERGQDKHRERLLLAFLAAIHDHCTQLYIIGDLFDYWFEYNTVVPKFHIRTLSALARLREYGNAGAGTEIHYLMGNHDFGHRTFFEEELDIRVYGDDVRTVILGKTFYLAHGDGKAYNDTGYLILKKILRNKINQWLWKWLHPDIGVGLAAYISRKSRAYTSDKSYGYEKNGLTDFAEQIIARDNIDYVVMGHLHQPMQCTFAQASGQMGVYMNIGDWLGHDTVAQFDGTSLVLCRVENVIQCLKSTDHSIRTHS